MRLGFLDWLAVQREAARPARLPVVFKLTDSAREAKPATALTRLQVDAAGASVILETENDVLRAAAAAAGARRRRCATADAFYLPPPGLSSLAPLEPLPTQWQLKSFASAGATKLQLDPEQGSRVDMLIEVGGQQYRITQAEQGHRHHRSAADATIRPEQSVVTKVTAFMPFDGAARNRQQHALYIGHKELFNIESAATIEILGAKPLAGRHLGSTGARCDPADEVGWQPLTARERGRAGESPTASCSPSRKARWRCSSW